MQTDGSGLTTSVTQTHTLRQTIPEECDFVLRLQELGQVMRKHQRFGKQGFIFYFSRVAYRIPNTGSCHCIYGKIFAKFSMLQTAIPLIILYITINC